MKTFRIDFFKDAQGFQLISRNYVVTDNVQKWISDNMPPAAKSYEAMMTA